MSKRVYLIESIFTTQCSNYIYLLLIRDSDLVIFSNRIFRMLKHELGLHCCIKRVIMFFTLAHKISYVSGRLIKVTIIPSRYILSDNKVSIYLAYLFVRSQCF